MRNFKIVLVGWLVMTMTIGAGAQKLLPAAYSFSTGQTAFLTLKDGSSVEGTISNMDRVKGLIKSIEIKDNNGTIQNFRFTQIGEMYIAREGMSKMGEDYKFLTDAAWNDSPYNQKRIQTGYALFEQTTVEMNGKKRDLLLQLLNPSFSSKIKVYVDPWADEITEPEKTTYYVKDGAFPAFKLGGNEYQDHFIALFGECESMVSFRNKAQWADLGKHIFEYTACR